MDYIRNIGYLSDCIFHNCNGQIVAKDDYFVIRTPSNPTYHWGNFLLFKKEPRVSDFDDWMAASRMEFGADAGHVTFGWDSDLQGAISDFESNGFNIVNDRVLSLSDLQPLERTNGNIKIRRIRGAKDWSQVPEIGGVEDDASPYGAFRNRMQLGYRSIQKAGHGDWWGAYIEDKLVGSLGLFFNPDHTMGRFQQVDTHPDFRNQGVCSTLLHHVAQSAISISDSLELILVTESDNPAINIYKKLGFEVCGPQYGASLPRPYARRFDETRSGQTNKSRA